MKTYLFCFALFVNLFQLGAGDVISNQYRSQFGNFLAKDKNNDGMLSAEEIENYHQGDVCSLAKAAEGVPVVNPGLFKNYYLFGSLVAVVKEIISKIKVESLNAVNMVKESSQASTVFRLARLLEEINKEVTANVQKKDALQILLTNLKRIPESKTPIGVQTQVVALFNCIIFHKSKGKREQLTLDEFLSFMAEKPTEKEILPSLIQTAFKDYMLGMINSRSADVITPDELEDFLRNHCAMEGNLSGNFEHFATEMDSADGAVYVETVREKWATMNLISCFNTLVMPSCDANKV